MKEDVASIKTTLNNMKDANSTANEALQSAKSAHHRLAKIDIFWSETTIIGAVILGLIAMFIITLIIVACAIAMSYMTQTTDVYAYLIPSIFAELSIGTGFYYWKARRENEIKLRGIYGVDEIEQEDEII